VPYGKKTEEFEENHREEIALLKNIFKLEDKSVILSEFLVSAKMIKNKAILLLLRMTSC